MELCHPLGEGVDFAQQKTERKKCGVLRTNDRAGRLRVLHLCGTFGRQKYPKSPGKRDGKSRRLPVCGAQSRRLAVAHAPLTAAPFPARFFCPRQRWQAKPRTPLRNVRRKRGSAGRQSPGPLHRQQEASPSGRGGSRQADGEGRRGGFHIRPGKAPSVEGAVGAAD